MNFILPGLGFLFIQTIGALIFLMSLKMFRVGFNKKDWGQLIIAIIFFLMGGYVFIFSSIMSLTDDFDNLKLTYIWTFFISILLTYFLYFVFPKTKFYKNYFKIKKKVSRVDNQQNEAPSLLTKIEGFFSDFVALIFGIAILLVSLYLIVKLVKYFWYF